MDKLENLLTLDRFDSIKLAHNDCAVTIESIYSEIDDGLYMKVVNVVIKKDTKIIKSYQFIEKDF